MSFWSQACHTIIQFYHANDFPLHILLAISLARAYPAFGAVHVQPHITATWMAVCVIFFLSGLGLRTADFCKILQQHQHAYFHVGVQVFNFAFVSAAVFGVSRLLVASHVMNRALVDGLVICACLPMAINVGIVLTAAAGGDEASAVFHATAGNASHIFLV